MALDQAVQETTFQWSAPFSALLEASIPGAPGPAMSWPGMTDIRGAEFVHWRGVFVAGAAGFVVLDFLAGSGHHVLAAHWHCGVEILALQGGMRFRAQSPIGNLTIETNGGAASIVSGGNSPILGWHAPFYGVKRPMQTLRVEEAANLPHSFTTRVRLDGEFGPLMGSKPRSAS